MVSKLQARGDGLSPIGASGATPRAAGHIRRKLLFGFLALLGLAVAIPVVALTTPYGQRLTAGLIEEPLLASLKQSMPASYVLEVEDLTTTVRLTSFDVTAQLVTVDGPTGTLTAHETHIAVRYGDVLRGRFVPQAIAIDAIDVDFDIAAVEATGLSQETGPSNSTAVEGAAVEGVNDEQEPDAPPSSARLDSLLGALAELDANLNHATTHPSWASLQTLTVERMRAAPRQESALPIRRAPPPVRLELIRQSADELRMVVETVERTSPIRALIRHARSDPPEGAMAMAEVTGASGFDDTPFTHLILHGLAFDDLTAALSGTGPITLDATAGAELVVNRDPQTGLVDQLALTLESEGAALGASGDHDTTLELFSLPLFYHGETGGFRVLGAQLQFPETGGTFAGVIQPTMRERGSGLDIVLQSNAYQLLVPASEALGRAAQELTGDVTLHAHVPDAGTDLYILLASVMQAGSGLALSGSIEDIAQSPVFTLTGQSSPMTATQLAAIWPLPVSPSAREWFFNSVVEAAVGPGTFTFVAEADAVEVRDGRTYLRDDMMAFALPYSNLVLRTVGDMPPIFGLDGELLITGRTVTLTGNTGAARMAGGETMSVGPVRFHIPDHAPRFPQASLELALEGPASGFVQMALLDPISLERDTLPFEAENVSGRVQMQAQLDAVLSKTMDRDAVQVQFEATLDDLASDEPIDGRQFSGGQFEISGDRNGSTIEGRALIDGVPTDLVLATGESEGLQLDMRLDAEARQSIGLDFGPYLDGVIGVRVGAERPDGSRPMDIDLTDASLTIAELGWTKPAGEPAQARFDLTENGEARRVNNLVLAAGGLAARGSLDFDGNELRNAQFETIALENVGRFALALTRNASQTAARISGERFTLVPEVLRGDREAAGSLSLELDLDELATAGGELLTGVAMTFAQDASGISAFDLRARHDDGSELVGTLAQRGAGNAVVISSGNAGTFLRFLGLYDRAEGGRATLVLDPQSVGGRVAGQLLLNDYVIVGEPAMERIFSDGSARDATSDIVLPGQFETSERVQIEVTSVSFDRSPERLVIRDAEGWGPSLGGNLSGVIDYAGDSVQLTGTFVPFFSINNIFSRIPILGTALGNRETEGLLGITFELVGTVDSPELRVNPMSLLAPGVIRNIFEYQQGG